jgi:phage terminase small subunit
MEHQAQKNRSPMNPIDKPLTDKQRRFVDEYLIDLNATAAYLRAGYKVSNSSADSAGPRLLGNVRIQAAIERGQKALAGKCEVTAAKVVREVAALAFSDARKMFDELGRMKNIHDLDDLTAASIASIEVDGSGITKIKLWDKNSAQERLCKHLGLFREDNSQKPLSLPNIKISFLDETKP